MTTYIENHPPNIAARIEFKAKSPPPLPSITPRIEFTSEHLAVREDGSEGEYPREVNSRSASKRQLRLRSRQRSGKIPKPIGEPGRPGSGGWCVETEMIKHSWAKQDIDELYVRGFPGR